MCQRKKVLSLSRGNTSSELIKLLSHYLAVTWHLLIKDKFVVLCDFSMGAGQLVGSSPRSALYLPARLAPSQRSWATTQDNLTETSTASVQVWVTVSDVVRQLHQAPRLWAAGKTFLGQQRSSPASYRARGCFVTILFWEVPLEAEHWYVHAACWKESGSTSTWNLVMWCCVHSPRCWALGCSECLLRCQFSRVTNCRAFWVEKQKLLHHEDQCPRNCPVPTWPWKIH